MPVRYSVMQGPDGVYHVFMAWRPGTANGMVELRYDSLCGRETAEETILRDGKEECVDCIRKLAKGGRGV